MAGLFAACAVVAFLFHMATAPTVLRLAAGPIGSDDVRMAAAIVQGVNREKSGIRLRLVLADGLADSARRLERGEADLAILRPDVAMPTRAETLLIMRRFFPFFVAGATRNIERVSELRGRRIGVVTAPAENVELLKMVLGYYELPVEGVEIVPLRVDDIQPAVSEGRIDVLFAVGALNASTRSPGVAVIRAAFGPTAVFIPIREADALAQRVPAIETGEIVRGAFGGDPPKPAEALPTISVTHRLVADQRIDDQSVAELTRRILSQRAALANEVPAMQGIEAPSTARDAALPVHPGAIAFLDGTERSFFDRYGDWFYLGVMAMSLLGSAGAAMLSQASQTRRRAAMQGLTRVVQMISAAREAERVETIEELEREADSILAAALDDMARQHIDEAGLAAYRLAMDQLGRAVAERRRTLISHEEGAAVS
jgi:TRAP transporter TAXI family solute receptor